MALLTIQQLNLTGLDLSAVDVAATSGGDTFNNNGKTFFYADNQSGGNITITFDDTGSTNPGSATTFDPDVELVITTLTDRIIGPFPTARFGTVVSVTYSAVTTLTVAAIRM
jgi:hypothetical protein